MCPFALITYAHSPPPGAGVLLDDRETWRPGGEVMGVEELRSSGRGADLVAGAEICCVNDSKVACIFSFLEEMSLEEDSWMLEGESVGLPAKIKLSRGGRKYNGRAGGE